MAKKRVAPPPAAGGWDLVHLDNKCENGWHDLCQQAPGSARAAYDQIIKDPQHHSDRQHPLRGEFGKKTVGGVEYEQWQYEATGGGRVWYVVDVASRKVIMTHAGVGHPKGTGG
jgi:hypothetical protein